MDTFKVKTNSWHYKILSSVNGVIPRDFCGYWRSLIFTLLYVATMVLGLVFLVIVIVGLFMAHPSESFAVSGLVLLLGGLASVIYAVCHYLNKLAKKSGYDKIVKNILVTILVVVLSPFIIVGVFLSAIHHLMSITYKKIFGTNHTKKYTKKGDNILVTKYKAWKNKYCPMVEIVDEV